MRTSEQLRQRIAELAGPSDVAEENLVDCVDELEEDIDNDLRRWNYDDPEERYRAITTLGVDRYGVVMEERRRRAIIKVVAGHELLRVNTGFGPLIMVGDTKTAFQTLEMAEAHARKFPKVSDKPPGWDAAS